MLANFHIAFSSSRRDEPLMLYSEDDNEQKSLLDSLDHFLAYYSGEFEVQIADRRLHFDFDPDLPTVFENLPFVLEQLTTDTTEPVFLHFFEQGTDLMLRIERRGEVITIHFYVGDYAGHQFRDLSDIGFQVRAKQFLSEWRRFALAVLAALGELQPEITSTTEFQEYRDRLAVTGA